ncbi:hypothetical protein SAMN04487928_11921 [Butyrivibrio proteoclasticus]|uniref:HTH cro/C1-type domain-containing protein n=1 Tax=Butyrivibrio proteoclasticus TaxID=43305 RepID=A0A1I5VUH2_9FIRM|nr:helix-turn-helix transcriptional regulator [Butyrivibrio proteoclasticus]SFQ11091.1 hypothetical protein SAMN04487928_11921 [Butyrivibrio proteoclasticus]
MTLFIENYNSYIDYYKIKQVYISKMSGIDKNKLSRILKGAQDETGADMEKMAGALGKGIDFFVSNDFSIPEASSRTFDSVAFYAGEPTDHQKDIAENLIEMMDNIDQVLGAKSRFIDIAGI